MLSQHKNEYSNGLVDNSALKHEWGNITVYETEESVVAKANVAGVPVNRITVALEDDVLIISAYYNEPKEELKERKVLYCQAREYQYLYEVSLPCLVKALEVTANAENGILTVTLPIEESEKPRELQANGTVGFS